MKYEVYWKHIVTEYATVEADSVDEAIEKSCRFDELQSFGEGDWELDEVVEVE